MKTAIIGYTGYIGGVLDKNIRFNDRYNSSNIGDIPGKEYDIVVCCGLYGDRFLINNSKKYKQRDELAIEKLKEVLLNVKTKKLILISTTDAITDRSTYARNRRMFEQFCSDNFNTKIIRLGNLIAKDLKKGFVRDCLNYSFPSFLKKSYVNKEFSTGEKELLLRGYDLDGEYYIFREDNFVVQKILNSKIINSLMYHDYNTKGQFTVVDWIVDEVEKVMEVDGDCEELNLISEPILLGEVAEAMLEKLKEGTTPREGECFLPHCRKAEEVINYIRDNHFFKHRH